MAHSFDAIVVGSGFGGAITACRLAEGGSRVLVLERGRRWQPQDYPRDHDDAWLFDNDEPHRQNGWIDLRIFNDMIVAAGAGVGGGSLIYANVSVPAHPALFHHGWPPEITFAELEPYYRTVGKMLDVQVLPDNQLTERYKLMLEAATRSGNADRFQKLPLAVTFDEAWSYELDDPFDSRHSKRFTNAFGKQQGTCVHLGNCDIGCDVQAKNTLDLNYLAQAEKHGAEIRPLTLVRFLEPVAGGYRVHFDRLESGAPVAGNESAAIVILAAGSLGSTEILLRCRDQYRTLPKLSDFLGRNWSSNGDFLTPAFYRDRRISPTHGPTISAAIDFLDGSVDGEQFFIEDGGLPNVVRNWLDAKMVEGADNRVVKAVLDGLRKHLDADDPLRNVMPWFSQGIDAADGRLYLARSWWPPWRRTGRMKLDWDIAESKAVIEAIVATHERFASLTGGRAWVPPTWTVFMNLITPHPLGGCNMGRHPGEGVTDHRGEVFGYPGLYVADGAIIPEAIGRNPSRTIAALAERIAHLMNG